MKPLCFGEAHDGPVARGTWLAFVAGEQVLEHGVQAAVFFMGEFCVFVKGKVAGAANFPHRTDYLDGLGLQSLEFLTHSFSPVVENFTIPGRKGNGTFVLRCG